jgi:hypothetical protein
LMAGREVRPGAAENGQEKLIKWPFIVSFPIKNGDFP